ncbi:MAG: TadA family conjugal transfer-associated ATPase [Actinomycetia bacterium]|nr:TadA family conjugal transfer-associated ATPase [Actinomycetes bacterium]
MDEQQLSAIRTHLSGLGRDWQPADVAAALREQRLIVSDALLLSTIDALRRSSVGAGPLEALLHLPGVTDVLVNGPDQVFLDRGRGLERTRIRFADDAEVRRLAARLAAGAGRRLDDASPCVDARLADGTRLHAVLAPIAEPGTCLSLRIPAKGGMTLSDWVSSGSIGPAMADVLAGLVAAKAAFLISGGTGTGKTTLLASLLSLVPPDQRLLIVEDSRELTPVHPHCVRLEARHANAEGAGAVSLTDLVRQALRMRPDRLVLGEVRGAELTDLLMALNTGHEGGCGTVHANSCSDVPSRLEALAALGGLGRDAAHAQIGSALHAVVHLRRGPDGRRTVEQVAAIQRGDDGFVRVRPAVTAHGTDLEAGPGLDELRQRTGLS